MALPDLALLDRETVRVDAGERREPTELWRHSVGLGGINSPPLPPRVVEGATALRPRLVRIFVQQFFDIYPEHGRFDWSRLDPYMDSLAATGARVVAAICLKPGPPWNEVPHRFGLFGERGQVRPQYFVHQLLGRLGDTKVACEVSHEDLHAYAASGPGAVSVLVSNTSSSRPACRDLILTLLYAGLRPGPKLLTVHRIDDQRRWRADTLTPQPLEQRVVVTGSAFEHQVLLPAHTVACTTLSERDGIR